MATEFGKELRKLRIDKDETLATMAKTMGISISYLSAIENGTRAIPDDFINRLSKKYRLSESATKKLLVALDHSVSSIDIELDNTLPFQRDLAFMLARMLPSMSEDICEKMLSILKENKDK